MASPESARTPGEYNPPDDLLARMIGLHPVAVRVRDAPALGAIEILITRDDEASAYLLAPLAALDLALRLIGCAARLRGHSS